WYWPRLSWAGAQCSRRRALLRNLRLDELREQRKRLLPPEVAILDRDHRGHPLLHDLEFGSAVDLAQRDRDLHLARHGRVLELVRVADSLAPRALDVDPK